MSDDTQGRALFDKLIQHLLGIEGGYANDPADSGGETIWGITKRFAVAYGYMKPMPEMTRDEAIELYWHGFWLKMKLDKVSALSAPIAGELLESGVNLGSSRAGEFLQRSLNVLNNGGTLYRDIAVDGDIGALTVAALNEYLGRRGAAGERVLYSALNSLQGAHYILLAEKRPKDEKFVFGWFFNRVS